MHFGREEMGVVCVSVITGTAAGVVEVEGGEDVGLTGGGAASLASMIIRLKVLLVPLVEDNVAGLNEASRWAMDKAMSLALLGVADERADE